MALLKSPRRPLGMLMCAVVVYISVLMMQQHLMEEGKGSESPFYSFVRKPRKDYEVYRRKAEDDVRELWFFARAELDRLIADVGSNTIADKLKTLKKGIYERQMSTLVNMEKTRQIDGFDSWRERESSNLSNIVHSRLLKLQQPAKCENASKFFCNLEFFCGYGCNLHHLVICVIMSYSMHRTFILKSKGWYYNPDGIQAVFKPLSNNCEEDSIDTFEVFPDVNDSSPNIFLKAFGTNLQERAPKQLPLSIPKDLAPRLIQLHGNPALWWIAQIAAFIQTPNRQTTEFLKRVESKFAIQQPYVGVHIRRTDKVRKEASFHSVEEYMSWVNEFFDRIEMADGPLDSRRVYLATDDPQAIHEAKSLYPEYVFFSDPLVSASAGLKTRYSNVSLMGVIADLHMLSRSDYIVCTLSSTLCRVAFQMMQLRFPDASQRYRSLDDIFHFPGQINHNEIAVLDHPNPGPGEISFVNGDLLGIEGNHWDGFSKGVNRRTGAHGLYPSFKAVELVRVEDFGEF